MESSVLAFLSISEMIASAFQNTSSVFFKFLVALFVSLGAHFALQASVIEHPLESAEEMVDDTSTGEENEDGKCKTMFDCPMNQICGDEGYCVDDTAECHTNDDCEGDLVCNAGICEEGVSDGGSCMGPSDCSGDLTCIDGTCQEGHGEGDACNSGECAPPLLCLHGQCQDDTSTGEENEGEDASTEMP